MTVSPDAADIWHFLSVRRIIADINNLEDRLVARAGFHVPALIVLGWFAVLLYIGFAFHEPWRDETQSWLMARDMSLSELFRNAAYDGHPIGWHLLIKPLTLLELPFYSLRLLNGLLVLGAAAVLIWSGPFRLWHTFFLVSSPPFVMCGVYARCYSLVLFALMMQAWFYPRRMDRPYRYAMSLGLLANTMILILPYASLMSAWWLWEAWKTRASRAVAGALLVLMVLGGFAAAQLIPPPDKFFIPFGIRLQGAAQEFLNLSGAEVWSFVIVPFIFFIPLTYYLLRCAPIPMAIALLSGFFALGIHAFLSPLYQRHYFTLFVLLLAVVWVAIRGESGHIVPRRYGMALCVALFIALCPESYYILRREVLKISSNTGYAVTYVQKHLRDKPVAAHFMSHVCPILAFVPGVEFWNPATENWDTFVVFKTGWYMRGEMPVSEAVEIIFEKSPVRRPVMIFSDRWNDSKKYDYELTFVSDYRSQYRENIFIYVPQEHMTKGMTALPVDFSRDSRRMGL